MKSLEKVGLRSLGKSFLFEPREDFLSLRAPLGGESLRFGLGIKPGPGTVSLEPPRPGWRAVAPSISVLESWPLVRLLLRDELLKTPTDCFDVGIQGEAWKR